jgi:hypothetical protein
MTVPRIVTGRFAGSQDPADPRQQAGLYLVAVGLVEDLVPGLG